MLQERLVPMAVHGLGLLEKEEVFKKAYCGDGVVVAAAPVTPKKGDSSTTQTIAMEKAAIDEEEEYFRTLEGMDEEIQIMAILARAASLNSTNNDDSTTTEQPSTDEPSHKNYNEMREIDSAMKCTAMLIFHIVLMASTPPPTTSDTNETSTNNDTSTSTATASAAGYDGRVRHVMKMACVDVLTKAILKSVTSDEASEHCKEDEATSQSNDTAINEKQQSQLFDVDEYTLWNIDNIKRFVDQSDLGKDAVFGTPYYKHSTAVAGETSAGGGTKWREKKKQLPQIEERQEQHVALMKDGEQSDNDHSSQRGDATSVGEQQQLSAEIDRDSQLDGTADSMLDLQLADSSESFETDAISEEEASTGTKEDDIVDEDKEECDKASQKEQEIENDQLLHLQQFEEGASLGRRQRNAKFLATRKFELIERLVAIDVVRFLMAEEREKKLREKEMREQQEKNKFMKVASLLRRGIQDDNGTDNEDKTVEEEYEDDAKQVDETGDGNDSKESENEAVASSNYMTAHRMKQIKRGLKIGAVGLTLGTVFAVTGGLAAPALAAGIGGLASLTGAGTASSAAILTVLATFKAGAALFGVGGGGLAAYKMKKRTAGLTEFSIRRENIEQYMYQVSVTNMGMFDMLMFNAKLRTIVIASSPGITRRKDEERH